MIIRAKHTCESDLRAFCTKCIWSISCTSSPRQNLIPILFYSFHLSLHCACLKTLFWLFWGNMFCKFAPSWQTGPHAGRSGASTYYFPCFWSTKQYLIFPIFVILRRPPITWEVSIQSSSRGELGLTYFCLEGMNTFNIAKGTQRTRGLSSAYQSNLFRSYHKLKNKSWKFIFRISTKHQFKNLNQTSASQLREGFK